jgi:hypothetical protein
MFETLPEVAVRFRTALDALAKRVTAVTGEGCTTIASTTGR